MSKYPTKQDIEKHTNQLIRDLRNYISGLFDINMVSNSLRCLFVDLGLDIENNDGEATNLNYEIFIKKLSKTKTGFPERK